METIAGTITSAGLLLIIVLECGVFMAVPVIKPSSRASAINQHIGQPVNQLRDKPVNQLVGQLVNQHAGKPVNQHIGQRMSQQVGKSNCVEILPGALICNVPVLDGTIDLTNYTGNIHYVKLHCNAEKYLPSRLSDGNFKAFRHSLKTIYITNCIFIKMSRSAFKGLIKLHTLWIEGGRKSQISRIDLKILNGSNSTQQTKPVHTMPSATTTCNYDNLVLPDGIFSDLDNLLNLRLVSMRLNNSVWQAVKILTNLETLYLQSNDITNIDINIINRLQRLKELDLTHNYIKVIQNGTFESLRLLRYLYLSTNIIRVIERDAFKGLSQLNILWLSMNYISTIEMGTFKGLTGLDMLGLSDNNIHTLKSGTFKELTALTELYLSGNRIHSLGKDTFKKLIGLNTLELFGNDICTIENNTFESLSRLESLDLSENSIHTLETGTFKGLTGLKTLDLFGNNISTIEINAFECMSSLDSLKLSGNKIHTLKMDTFKTLTGLKRLDLSKNNIKTSEVDAFNGLLELGSLNLSGNIIHTIKMNQFKGLSKLHTLDLSENYISTVKMDTLKALGKLDTLNLSRNSISTVETDTFAGLRTVRQMFLAENQIKTIALDALSQLTTLRNLDLSDNHINMFPTFPSSVRFLNLGNNNIVEIDTSSVAGLTNLITLDLSDNTINEFTHYNIPNTIEELDISSNHISVASFHLPPYLRYANLRSNQIKSLALHSLQKYREKNSSDTIYLEGNGDPFHCVCNLEVLNNESIFNYDSSSVAQYHIWDFASVTCSSKNTNESREITEIHLTEFSCQYNTFCPKTCSCYLWKYRENINIVDCHKAGLKSVPANISVTCTLLDLSGNMFQSLFPEYFDDLSQVTGLYLKASNITEVKEGTFRKLVHLVKLDLGHNKICQLNPGIFAGLSRLSSLDLSFNSIHMIIESTFESLKRLKYLDLSRNKLQTITSSVIESMHTLKSLYLSQNQWSCNCTFLESFIPLTTTNSVQDQSDIICFTSNKTEYRLIKIVLTDFCPHSDADSKQSKQMTTLEMALSISLSLFVTGTFLFCIVLKNKDFLKLLCFIKCGWRPGKNEMDRHYDAFVSYSGDDTAFIVNEVMPRLEEPGQNRPAYKLCVHFRDFPVGACIANTILAAIARSKRVIIILSDNFLSSEWCHYEFQAAHYQLIDEKKNRIIMVLLHDINNDLLDEKLKLFLRTRTYVKYGDPRFWNKIEYVMPKLNRQAEGNLNGANIDDQINDIPAENIQDDVPLLN